MHRLLSTPQGASPITAAALAVSAAGVLIHRSNTASASTAPCIHLASTKVDGSCEMPTLVLVHGLDSTRFTWNPFMERNAGRYKMIAVDLRGHGESALGDESHFTAEAVAADIRHTLREEKVALPVVLLGHSMGGRVAMEYGAEWPEDLAGLIVEDMDMRQYSKQDRPADDLRARRAFDRSFDSWEQAKRTLLRWYQEGRVDGWSCLLYTSPSPRDS
eukprot:TRINITY_DN11815_c0_g1_i2.p1 TRINITY_DN11815_c0_g1~~TRINITY_DN11815_c0_g1_i2.p1  ORF type:complete len:217 (-),score=47.86 TRINITY_DN11815_c0_g1_i2:101-751(-)